MIASITNLSQPQFSVVIPLYNKRPYIRRAVNSVLTQTYHDFEMIVVDDGSTDGSANELLDLKDHRLKIIRQNNSGEGAARNTGIIQAQGKWVAFLDADDEWMPFHLEELHRIENSYPHAGLISTTCKESIGEEISAVRNDNQYDMLIREVDYFLEASLKIGFINSTSAAVRSDVTDQIGGFSARRTGADLEYWIKVALRYPVAVSHRVTCIYYRDTGGVMQQVNVNKPRATYKPVLSMREFSTPLDVLCIAAEEDPTIWDSPSIRNYVNSTLILGIKGSLFRGDTSNAKNISRMLLRPITIKQQVLKLLLLTPSAILQAAISTTLNLKKWLRNY